MAHFVALLFFVALLLIAFFLVLYASKLLLQNIKLRMNKHAKRISEQSINRDKILDAISIIHSAKNSNALNGALKDFVQGIAYHKAHNIKFMNRDLGRLNLSVIKFAKYKALKLYGLDLQREALRDYLLYIKKNV